MRTAKRVPRKIARKAAEKRVARRVLSVARILMGLFFVGFGIHACFGTPHAGVAAGTFALGGLLMKAGFLFPLLKGAETLLEQYVSADLKRAASR